MGKNTDELKKQNRIALIFVAVAALLLVLLFSLPLCFFDVTVYTQKSSNTFVGDEKYIAARAEAEAVAEQYRADGFDVTVDETVTERTNSKGETTSLVAFSINQTVGKNLWSFLSASFGSARIFRVMFVCLLVSVCAAFLGTLPSMDKAGSMLSKRDAALRWLTSWLAFAAGILSPAFILANNVVFSRRLSLYRGGQLEEGKDAFYASLGKFLLGRELSDNAESMLKQLSFTQSGLLWLLIPVCILLIVSGISLRFGIIKYTLLRMVLYVFVVVVCVVTIYPYYVMLITAFRSNAETTDMYFLHLLPTKWVFENMTDIVRRGVPRYLLNSVLIAGGATAIAMFCGIPAAYAMARMGFKGKKPFLGFVIMSQMFSPVVLLIGIAQQMNTLHLNDSILGLMLINAAFNQAFAIWLLRGTFVAISSEMEQAAMIDGCSTLGALTKVLIPVSAPGIVTALIFVFINAWNEYTISTVLISTASNRPITVGITQFSSFNMIEWQYLFAASLLATIPVVILFMCIEKHLVSGLSSGGVKG